MGLKGRQFRLLLWKNFILQIRRPIGTTFELLLPFFATALLLLARLLLKSDDLCFTTFEPGFSEQNSLSTSDIERLQTCVTNGTGCPQLAYHPNNNLTSALMLGVALQVTIPLSPSNFSSEEELVKKAAEDLDSYYGVIVFDIDNDTTTLPKDVTYKIRLPHDIVQRETWQTERTYPIFDVVGPRLYNLYKTRFLALQLAVDSVIAGFQLAEIDGLVGAFQKLRTVQVQLQQFPHPAYLSDRFLLTLEFLMPFLLCLSFIYTAGTIVRELVLEKELRLKESMKMMGLANWVHWSAWFIKNAVFLLVPIILITIMLKVGRVFPNSDPSVIFVFLFLWLIASIAWGFAISVLFSRARLGLIFGFVLWFANYLPLMFITYDSSTIQVKTASCLLSNVAFGFGVTVIALFEGKSVGLQWSNVTTSPSLDDPFTMGTVFLMFTVDTLIYLVLTWYIEAVFPGSYGIPKPAYFPFQRSYWCGTVAKQQVANGGQESEIGMNAGLDPANHEASPDGIPAGIKIQGLTKVYKSSVGNKLAVDNLSLNMYQGQITALLGHNGAGKTTTTSILTGLFPPSAGTAYVNGYNIRTDVDQARRSLGLCPQHNVLFDRLTVKEHLDFFIALKGKSGKEADQEVRNMIADLQLVDKTRAQSSNLSGGMKRKLSCAIALIGGSEVVILDEPTSGMDPYARRATWDLLQKYRRGRTMVLTTHFMDEADLLGDRIAILANGQLSCSGTPLFLKNRFGVGYHLTLVRNRTCAIDSVRAVVSKHVPQAVLEGSVGNELDFILPRDDTAAFKHLFKELEGSREVLGIDSFGVSITTMEEVFMKAGEMAGKDVDGSNPRGNVGSIDAAMESGSASGQLVDMGALHTGMRLKWHQFGAVFVKRFLYSRRDKKSLITQFLLPLLFVVFALLIIKTGGDAASDPPRILTLANISRHDAAVDVKTFYADLRNESRGSVTIDGSTIEINGTFFTFNGTTVTFNGTAITFNDSTIEIHWMDVFEYLPSVMDPLGITYINVSSPVVSLMEENSGDLIQGEPRTNDDDCCAYPNMILNEACAKTLYNNGEKGDLCQDVEGFGYHNCLSCLTSTSFDEKTNSSESSYDADGTCPIGANQNVLMDGNTFFQEYVLRRSENDTAFFNKYVAGLTLTESGLNQVLLTGWYSNEAYHTSSEVLNAMANLVLKYFTNDSYSITTINHPLPNSATNQVENAASSADTFTLSLLILYGVSFLAASFIHFIVTEKQSKAKHLQMVSGLDGLTYWTANLCWDAINYLVVFLCIIVIFAVFDLAAFGGRNLGTVAVLLLLFGWAAIPLVYSLSFLFKTPATAYAVTATFLTLVGTSMVIIVFVLEVIGTYDDEVNIVDHIFMLLPTHCLARGLIQLATNVAIRDTCSASELDMEICEFANITYTANNLDWDEPGVGQHALYLAVEGLVFLALTLLLEMNFFIPSRSAKSLKAHNSATEVVNMSPPSASFLHNTNNGLDVDVANERSKVDCLDPKRSEYAIVLKDLSKTFRNTPSPAVDQLSLAVPKGECFGLLGVNGAGKTTSFGMLTGDLGLTAGEAYMEGYSIQTRRRKAQQRMGYCPQFDALVERLTGRELLTLFARLRGIPGQNLNSVVKSTIAALNLDNWADKLCGTYSGGNKRKLNTAIAIVGNPPIVLLDEPTSGMDPKARRHLWDALTMIMREGRSIVLTSHSMEECEALCTRLAIMVNGQFQCLGSAQHLKSRFGTGYTIMIKVQPNADVQIVKNFVQSVFDGACLVEEHQGLLHYQVNNEHLSWSYIFGTVEESRVGLDIADYSVSQTTLEQVFLNFAKMQHGEHPTSKSGRRQRPSASYTESGAGRPMPVVNM